LNYEVISQSWEMGEIRFPFSQSWEKGLGDEGETLRSEGFDENESALTPTGEQGLASIR
jgi:hypothetical protein